MRADRLDAVVWQSLSELLRTPTVIPQLHHTWAQAKQQDLTTLTAQHAQVLQRRQRLERQVQRLLDAYQAVEKSGEKGSDPNGIKLVIKLPIRSTKNPKA